MSNHKFSNINSDNKNQKTYKEKYEETHNFILNKLDIFRKFIIIIGGIILYFSTVIYFIVFTILLITESPFLVKILKNNSIFDSILIIIYSLSCIVTIITVFLIITLIIYIISYCIRRIYEKILSFYIKRQLADIVLSNAIDSLPNSNPKITWK